MIGGYLTPQNVSPLVQWSGCLHSTSESLIDAGSNLCNDVKGDQKCTQIVHRRGAAGAHWAHNPRDG